MCLLSYYLWITKYYHTICGPNSLFIVGEPTIHPYWSPNGLACDWQAPSEAEAQCAALALEGAVYGTATEDMDALTFKTPKLLRRMTFSGASQPILEVDYQKLLQVCSVGDRYLDTGMLGCKAQEHCHLSRLGLLSTAFSITVPVNLCCEQGLDFSHEKFVDLCILCGCDYTGSIKGIGPKKAFALIRQVKHKQLPLPYVSVFAALTPTGTELQAHA